MLDTAERDQAIAELQRERELRQKAEVEAAQMRLSCQMAQDEVKQLMSDLEQQRAMLAVAQAQRAAASNSTSNSVLNEDSVNVPEKSFKHLTTVKLNEQGKCRVMSYYESQCDLYVSQPSSNPLFPGFGIRKFSVIDYKPSQFVNLHTQAIRDIAINQRSSLILTCSLDKTLKLTSPVSNAAVQT